MAIFAKERQLTPSWDLLQPSWLLLKKNLWQIVYLSFIPNLIVTLGLILTGSYTPHATLAYSGSAGWGLIALCVGGLLTLLTYPGYITMLSQAVQGNTMTASAAFKEGLRRLPALIGAMLLAGLAIGFGFVLFIVPGVILLRALYFAPYYVVDQKLGPIAALKQSSRDSKPVSAWVWGVIGVTLVFSIVGSFVSNIPLVGYILSIVVAYPYVFGPALRYAEITHRRQVAITPETTTAA